MNILFDLFSAQPFSTKAKFNGGGQYVKNIFKQFVLRNENYNNIIYCTYNSNFYLDNEILELCKKFNIELLDINKYDLNHYIINLHIDKVFIGILQRHLNLTLSPNVKLIIVVHDLRDLEILPSREELLLLSRINGFKSIFKLFTILFFYSLWRRFRIFRNLQSYHKIFFFLTTINAEIWTDSVHTKYLLLSFFPFLNKSKVLIFWPPEILIANNNKKILEVEDLKFCLMVSSDHWEKNTINTINSFILINKNRSNKINLVIVGDLSSTLLKYKIQQYSWIIKYKNLEDSEIEWLYSRAYILIYLSYVEGFGYPPIHAMKYGTPVLASATSSIMEICENAPLYSCPYSKTEILARLNFILSNDISQYQSASVKRYNQIIIKQRIDLNFMIRNLHN